MNKKDFNRLIEGIKQDGIIRKGKVAPIIKQEELQMEKNKKKESKESVVFKPSVSEKTIVSTVKKPAVVVVEQPAKPAAEKAPVPLPPKKENDATKAYKAPECTGKEKQRYWEWVKYKTQIRIKLINGDTYQGYLKWYDKYAVKLITTTDEIMIHKHNILCYFDGPKVEWAADEPENECP